MVDARTVRIDADQTWAMLCQATSVITVRGSAIQRWNPQTDSREAILQQAIGPSGNLRAPTLRQGTHFLIGFHPDLYASWPDPL